MLQASSGGSRRFSCSGASEQLVSRTNGFYTESKAAKTAKRLSALPFWRPALECSRHFLKNVLLEDASLESVRDVALPREWEAGGALCHVSATRAATGNVSAKAVTYFQTSHS